MSHLNIPEMIHYLDGLYSLLLGDETYCKWRQLKSRIHIVSEASFITWLVEYAGACLDRDQALGASPAVASTTSTHTLDPKQEAGDELQQIKMANMTVVLRRDAHPPLTAAQLTPSQSPAPASMPSLLTSSLPVTSADDLTGPSAPTTTVLTSLNSYDSLWPQMDVASVDLEAVPQACEDVDLTILCPEIETTIEQQQQQQQKINPIIRIHLPSVGESSEGGISRLGNEPDGVGVVGGESGGKYDAGDSRPTERLNKFSSKMLLYKFRCDTCFALFKEQADVDYHHKFIHHSSRVNAPLKNHQGLYECQYCGLTFAHKMPWREHELSHHSSASCELCGKEFGSLNSKYRHVTAVHHKAKYECDVCGNIFGDASDRRRHMKQMHHHVDHQCKVCGLVFTRLVHLTRHTKAEHNWYK